MALALRQLSAEQVPVVCEANLSQHLQGLLHDPPHLDRSEGFAQAWDPHRVQKRSGLWTECVACEEDDASP